MIRSLGMSSWILAAILLVVLCAASIVAFAGWNLWNLDAGTDAIFDYVALGMAALFVVGIGLTVLIFYSSRHECEQPPAQPGSHSTRDS
jgi:hypothetical protein